MEPKICPNCKEKNNPAFAKCWKCGYSFADGKLSDRPLIRGKGSLGWRAMIILGVFGFGILSFVLSIAYPMFFTSKERLFQIVFDEPVPSTVKILGGHGSLHMGYSITLVFATDPGTLERLATGYENLGKCSEAVPDGKWPSLFSTCRSTEFLFKKYVTNASPLTCYYKTSEASHERSELCYDGSNKMAFLYAVQS